MFVTEGDAYHYNEMITHVPMISHPCPKNILIIGGGTGASTHEVLKHNTVEKVVVVDIDEEVVNIYQKLQADLIIRKFKLKLKTLLNI